MPVIRFVPTNPADLVLQGEQLRTEALASVISTINPILAGSSDATASGQSVVIAGSQSFPPMQDGMVVISPLVVQSELLTRANNGIVSPSGAFIAVPLGSHMMGGFVGGTTTAAAVGYSLIGNAGSYSLAGSNAVLKVSRQLTGNAGSYGLLGGSASLITGRKLTANAGTYALTGGSAVLTKAGATSYTLTGLEGAYSLSGGSAELTLGSGSVGGGYDDKKKRKFVVKVGDRLMVFSNAADAINALPSDRPKLEKKAAKKAAKKAEETVKLIEIASIASTYQQETNYQLLLAQQQYEKLIQLYEQLRQQEEDDIEVLLMAL